MAFSLWAPLRNTWSFHFLLLLLFSTTLLLVPFRYGCKNNLSDVGQQRKWECCWADSKYTWNSTARVECVCGKKVLQNNSRKKSGRRRYGKLIKFLPPSLDSTTAAVAVELCFFPLLLAQCESFCHVSDLGSVLPQMPHKCRKKSVERKRSSIVKWGKLNSLNSISNDCTETALQVCRCWTFGGEFEEIESFSSE